jgi:hypothetical protein
MSATIAVAELAAGRHEIVSRLTGGSRCHRGPEAIARLGRG